MDAALGKLKPGQPKSSGRLSAAMWPGEDGNVTVALDVSNKSNGDIFEIL